ncbi:MAG: CopD family protein [Alphaproteobacteria bacterium]
MLPLAIGLHTLAAVIWVGGMFFAHMVLRPAVGPMTPKDRLELWSRVFPRFFAWVWAAVIVLTVTGYGAIFLTTGLFDMQIHVMAMMGTATVMMGLFVLLYCVPYPRFMAALAAGDLPGAAGHQATIRRIVTVNLALGLLTSAIGAAGRTF